MTRMFSGNFKESKSELTEIEIPNFTTESFLLFLEYLYSDHVNFENADVFEVLKIADMYCQTRLLTMCEYCVSRKAQSWTLRKRADLVFQVLLCVQVGQGQRSRTAMNDNLVSTRVKLHQILKLKIIPCTILLKEILLKSGACVREPRPVCAIFYNLAG